MNSKLLLQTIKDVLKKKKKTYAQLASDLSISEVSIKRIFSEERCTLERLDEICAALDISILDVLRFADTHHESTFQFTSEVEQFFADNYEAFQFWNEIYKNQLTPNQAAEALKINKSKMRSYLRRFEQFQLLEVHPRDRLKFKVSGTLNLRDGGVLQEKLTRAEVEAFLDRHDPFESREIQTFTMSHRKVCRKTLAEMNGQLMRLFQEFRDRAYREERLLTKEELVPVQWLGGINPITPLAAAHLPKTF